MMSLFRLFRPPDVTKLEGERNIQGLIKALRYRDSGVRYDAAWALGIVGDTRGISPLIIALADNGTCSHGPVSYAAKTALERIGIAALEPLVEALQHNDHISRPYAAEAILNIVSATQSNNTNIVEPLIRIFRNHRFTNIREKVARILGKLGDKRAVESLIYTLNENQRGATLESRMVSEAAIVALGELRASEAIPQLIRALSSNHQQLSNAAAWTLRNIADKAAFHALAEYDARLAKQHAAEQAKKALTCKWCHKTQPNKSNLIMVVSYNEIVGFDTPVRREPYCLSCTKIISGPRTSVEVRKSAEGYKAEWHAFTIES